MPKEEEKTQNNLEIACKLRKNSFYIELVQKEVHKNYLGKKNNFYIEFVDSNVYMIRQLSFAIFCLSWVMTQYDQAACFSYQGCRFFYSQLNAEQDRKSVV